MELSDFLSGFLSPGLEDAGFFALGLVTGSLDRIRYQSGRIRYQIESNKPQKENRITFRLRAELENSKPEKPPLISGIAGIPVVSGLVGGLVLGLYRDKEPVIEAAQATASGVLGYGLGMAVTDFVYDLLKRDG